MNRPINALDGDLFSLFSDLYKDRNNFRPRHHVTRAEAQRWLDELPCEPVFED